MDRPTLELEQAAWDQGIEFVAGVDEVGRGAWAGPLTVCIAVLPVMNEIGAGELALVRDSKLLSERQRERLFDVLAPFCVTWAIGHAEYHECDELGMSSAQRLAAGRALQGIVARLGCSPGLLLLDGKWDFLNSSNSVAVVKGDQRSFAIATASVLAKVSRDRIIRAEHQHYPVYDFENNKGYPSLQHRMALAAWGPSPIHRRSWSFMDKLIWQKDIWNGEKGSSCE